MLRGKAPLPVLVPGWGTLPAGPGVVDRTGAGAPGAVPVLDRASVPAGRGDGVPTMPGDDGRNGVPGRIAGVGRVGAAAPESAGRAAGVAAPSGAAAGATGGVTAAGVASGSAGGGVTGAMRVPVGSVGRAPLPERPPVAEEERPEPLARPPLRPLPPPELVEGVLI
jgi:hypothetical protein